jgi:PiT family inorganic phosphate transporter
VVLKIVSTWVACPVLSGLFSAVLYKSITWGLQRQKLHLLRLDSYTRWGLIVVGALASYALGANNIANVMGVFVPSDPFRAIAVGHLGEISAAQQLFLLGAIAIAVGVYTDSQKVMMTVGNNLMPLNPIGAFVVVLAEFIVLFIFSSSSLQHLFIQWGLPPIPLIPVSSAQAAVGAVIGVGLLKGAKGARQINWRVLQDIVSSWISTPIMAAVISFILLFVVQNVFDQPVYLR